MYLYNKGRCKQAIPKLKIQTTNKKLKSGSKSKVFHHLGVCEFKTKNYDNSVVYLSKVVTIYPKSYFVRNALYYLGKNFKAQGQKEQAKDAFNEVIKRYPKSKQGGWAKDQLKGL